MELILNKKDVCLPHVSSIFKKKISSENSGTHCMKLSIMLPVSIAGSNTRVASLTSSAVLKRKT